MASEVLAFYLFGALAIGASLLVIAQRNPIYSVLLLIASFGALSGLYVLLDAPFVAVTQIIVYAGAIMVLFLFVVMLLNAPHEETDFDERVHPLLRPGPMRLGAVCRLLNAQKISTTSTADSTAPNRRGPAPPSSRAWWPVGTSSVGTFSSMTTKRKSTMMAPAYTMIWITATNGASRRTYRPDSAPNDAISSSTL